MNFDTRRCNFDTKCNISIRKDALRYNFNIRCQYKKIHYDTCCNQSNTTLEACQWSIRFGHLSKCNLIPLWRYQIFFYKLQFLEFHFKAFPIWLFYMSLDILALLFMFLALGFYKYHKFL